MTCCWKLEKWANKRNSRKMFEINRAIVFKGERL